MYEGTPILNFEEFSAMPTLRHLSLPLWLLDLAFYSSDPLREADGSITSF
jgi:hypothetical protein